MSLRFLFVFLVCLEGCGKSPDSRAPAAGKAREPVRGVEAVPAPEQPPDPAAGAADLGELTQALRKYSFEHQRVPKNFSEVIAAGYVKNMPQPPAGKKFGIDANTVQVILVKQ